MKIPEKPEKPPFVIPYKPGVYGSSVSKACNSWSGGCRFDSLPGAHPYWLGQCQYNVSNRLRQKSWFTLSVSVRQLIKLSDVSLGTWPQDSQLADDDITKP